MNSMNVMMLITPKANVSYLYDKNSLKQGLEKMRSSGYTAIPVIRETGEFVGVVTEGDFLWHFVEKCQGNAEDLEECLVGDILRKDSYAPAKIDESSEDLLNKSLRQNFVPVVDDRGCFCGIVTRRDIIKHFVK